jgi:hypothetical protein
MYDRRQFLRYLGTGAVLAPVANTGLAGIVQAQGAPNQTQAFVDLLMKKQPSLFYDGNGNRLNVHAVEGNVSYTVNLDAKMKDGKPEIRDDTPLILTVSSAGGSNTYFVDYKRDNVVDMKTQDSRAIAAPKELRFQRLDVNTLDSKQKEVVTAQYRKGLEVLSVEINRRIAEEVSKQH